MADPNWNKGFYYDGMPPHTGMKLARRRVSIFFASFMCTDPPAPSQKSPLSPTDLDQSGTFDSDENSDPQANSQHETVQHLVPEYQLSVPTSSSRRTWITKANSSV
jgi:homoserine acetyltransferase